MKRTKLIETQTTNLETAMSYLKDWSNNSNDVDISVRTIMGKRFYFIKVWRKNND